MQKIVISEMFGPHLTLDLYGCDKEKLSDYSHIYKLLDELPELIGMNKFSAPHLSKIPKRENSFDQGGLTGFVILVESHISIHTFPADSFASVDVFSCKHFDAKFASKYLTKHLGATKVEFDVKRRGREFVKHYPKSVKKAGIIASHERVKAKQTVHFKK
jgi:S-adenosylmethionine decarboxylase